MYFTFMVDRDQQGQVGEAVDFTNVYVWGDAGGNAYYVKGTLSFPARVELTRRAEPGEGPIIFEVIAHRQQGSGPAADHEFVAWGAAPVLAEVEIHGRSRIWRSALDKAEPWIPRVEPGR